MQISIKTNLQFYLFWWHVAVSGSTTEEKIEKACFAICGYMTDEVRGRIAG